MDLSLTGEQEQLRSLAHDFASQRIRPLACELDRAGRWPGELVRAAWEAGLMNGHIPPEYGGPGHGFLSGCLVAEELAWGCAGVATSLMANGLATAPVLLAGGEALKRRYLPPLCEAPRLASFCLTEPEAGSDVANLRTRAVRKGAGYELTGQKSFITNGSHADWFTVYAKTDEAAGARGISAFVVERAWGVTVDRKEDKLGQRASDTAAVSFDGVEVPAENLVGEENTGFRLAMATLDRTRPGVAAAAVGIARAAFELALDHAKRRTPGGSPPALQQGVQFALADMATKVDAARLLTWRSAVALEQGRPNRLSSAQAKRFAADAAMEVTSEAVDVFGACGMTRRHLVEKLMRDAKLMQIYEGTSQVQRLVIAREILSPRRRVGAPRAV